MLPYNIALAHVNNFVCHHSGLSTMDSDEVDGMVAMKRFWGPV